MREFRGRSTRIIEKGYGSMNDLLKQIESAEQDITGLRGRPNTG